MATPRCDELESGKSARPSPSDLARAEWGDRVVKTRVMLRRAGLLVLVLPCRKRFCKHYANNMAHAVALWIQYGRCGGIAEVCFPANDLTRFPCGCLVVETAHPRS